MFDTQQEALEGVDTTDTDGDGLYDTYEIAGMIIPNGQYIYSDPLKPDTDGDGLTDSKEMGELRSLSQSELLLAITNAIPGYSFNGELSVHYLCFDYISNPNFKDSDGNGAFDNEDREPLNPNNITKMNYIFYKENAESFINSEVNMRYGTYIIENRECTLISINTTSDFVNAWSSMEYDVDNYKSYKIDEVVIVCHGNPYSQAISDCGWLYGSQLNSGYSESCDISITNLKPKTINFLILSSCNSGNLD